MASIIYRIASVFAILAIIVVTGLENMRVCPHGWSHGPYGKSCLKLFGKYDVSERLSWDESMKACSRKKAELVKVTDIREHRFVGELVSGYYRAHAWIGVYCQRSHDLHFTYWDGTPLPAITDTFWKQGEPDGVGGIHCVSVATYVTDFNKTWMDIPCTWNGPYVCSIPSIVCPSGWKLYRPDNTCLKVYGGRYGVSPENKSWMDALHMCKKTSSHANLVMIRDEDKRNFVLDLLESEGIDWTWIGIRRTARYPNGHGYYYADTSELGDYEQWVYNRPDYFDVGMVPSCVAIPKVKEDYFTGYWFPFNCNLRISYVCSLDLFPRLK